MASYTPTNFYQQAIPTQEQVLVTAPDVNKIIIEEIALSNHSNEPSDVTLYSNSRDNVKTLIVGPITVNGNSGLIWNTLIVLEPRESISAIQTVSEAVVANINGMLTDGIYNTMAHVTEFEYTVEQLAKRTVREVATQRLSYKGMIQ